MDHCKKRESWRKKFILWDAGDMEEIVVEELHISEADVAVHLGI
jgi:hypothetical protein